MPSDTNPLLAPSTRPFDLPDYAAIRPEHYLPAFRVAFAEHRAEVDAITRVRSMPTFQNTPEPLAQSGRRLDAFARALFTGSFAAPPPELQLVH